MNQVDQSDEYIKFWIKVAKNTEEIWKEYDKLTPENKQRVSMKTQEIVMSQGIVSILEYAKSCDKYM